MSRGHWAIEARDLVSRTFISASTTKCSYLTTHVCLRALSMHGQDDTIGTGDFTFHDGFSIPILFQE